MIFLMPVYRIACGSPVHSLFLVCFFFALTVVSKKLDTKDSTKGGLVN